MYVNIYFGHVNSILIQLNLGVAELSSIIHNKIKIKLNLKFLTWEKP